MSDFDRLMGDSLKAIRDDHLREIEAEVPAARRQIAAKVRRRRFTFVIGGTALAAAAVAAFVFVSQTVPDIDRAEPIRPSGEPVILSHIDVPGVTAIEAGLDKLWVAHGDGVVGIDPATGSIAMESPTDVEDMAMDSEAMFVINSKDRSLSRLPFGTNEAATGTTMEGTPTLVAASDEAVWVAAATGPGGRSQITTYTPHLEMPGDSAVVLEERVVADMVHVGDSLWLTAARGQASGFELHRFWDVGGESIWELTESEGPATDIAVGEGAAWVLRQTTQFGGDLMINAITRVGLDNEEVVDRAVEFGDPIESIAVGEGYLWVTTAPTGMNRPKDARASLHRIDPITLEPVGEPLEVAGPGSQVEVGYGYVWVADPNDKQIVQIDPFGKSSPEPEPSATPDPDTTEDSSILQEQCRTFLPFLSTDADAQLGLGSGGQTDVPLADQSPSALVHYAFGQGRYIDVIAGTTVWSPVDEEWIEVLNRPATLHRIEDGFAVSFQTGGCAENQLIAYGLNEDALRDFVATLTLRGHAETSHDAFAMWPETEPEDAYESCLLVGEGAQPFRTNAQETALEFARAQLRWPHATLTENASVSDMEQGYELFTVIRGDSEDPPRVELIVREVAPDCWSISSVHTPTPPRALTSLSVSKTGSRLSVGFDLALRGLDDSAATIRIPVEDGSVSMTAEEFRSQDQRIEGVFRHLSEGGPSGFLVLIEDADGLVIGAIGMALPSSDFVAG